MQKESLIHPTNLCEALEEAAALFAFNPKDAPQKEVKRGRNAQKR